MKIRGNDACGCGIMPFLFVAVLVIAFIMGDEPSTQNMVVDMESCSSVTDDGAFGSEGQLTEPCVTMHPRKDSLPLQVCEGNNVTIKAKIDLPHSWYRGQLISVNNIGVTGRDNGQMYIQGEDASGTDSFVDVGSDHAEKGRWKSSVFPYFYVDKSAYVYSVNLSVSVRSVATIDEHPLCIIMEHDSVKYKHCLKNVWFLVFQTGKNCPSITGDDRNSTHSNGSDKNDLHKETSWEQECVCESLQSCCKKLENITFTELLELIKLIGKVHENTSNTGPTWLSWVQFILLLLLLMWCISGPDHWCSMKCRMLHGCRVCKDRGSAHPNQPTSEGVAHGANSNITSISTIRTQATVNVQDDTTPTERQQVGQSSVPQCSSASGGGSQMSSIMSEEAVEEREMLML